MLTIVIYLFLAIGVIFNALGSIALLRFPDVYIRLHGATKCTTFGSIFIALAVIVYGIAKGGGEYWTLSMHAAIALICLLLTNPTGAHAIARAAHKSGTLPKFAVVDKLEESRR